MRGVICHILKTKNLPERNAQALLKAILVVKHVLRCARSGNERRRLVWGVHLETRLQFRFLADFGEISNRREYSKSAIKASSACKDCRARTQSNERVPNLCVGTRGERFSSRERGRSDTDLTRIAPHPAVPIYHCRLRLQMYQKLSRSTMDFPIKM